MSFKQCKHHTKDVYSVYKWIHFGNVIIIIMYGKFDNFSIWNTPLHRLPYMVMPMTW